MIRTGSTWGAPALLVMITLGGCGSTKEERAATGAAAGLVVAGPVGAAVGATVGAVLDEVEKEKKKDQP